MYLVFLFNIYSKMEKLIELLNKYVKEKGMNLTWRWNSDDFWVGDSGEALSESIMISKNYGFIDWLIENKHIDLKKIPIRFEYYMQWDTAPYSVNDDTNILLMELSITAFPVDLLINLLSD